MKKIVLCLLIAITSCTKYKTTLSTDSSSNAPTSTPSTGENQPVGSTPTPTPTPSGDDFALENPQINNIAQVNQLYNVSPKSLLQLPSFSFGKNNVLPGFKFQMKKEGRTIYNLQMANDTVSPFDSGSDNHPTRMNIVLPEGTYNFKYKHESVTHPEPIAFTMFAQYDEKTKYTSFDGLGTSRNYDIPQNYRSYSENGLSDVINKSELRPGNITSFDTLIKEDKNIQPLGNLSKKYLHFNFISNGRLLLEDVMVDWSGGNFSNMSKFYNFISSGQSSTFVFTVGSNVNSNNQIIDRNKYIKLQINAGQNGQTGVFKLLEKSGGLDISEEHLSISRQSFGSDSDPYQYVPAAIKQYKVTNNFGCISGNNLVPMSTSFTIRSELNNYDCH